MREWIATHKGFAALIISVMMTGTAAAGVMAFESQHIVGISGNSADIAITQSIYFNGTNANINPITLDGVSYSIMTPLHTQIGQTITSHGPRDVSVGFNFSGFLPGDYMIMSVDMKNTGHAVLELNQSDVMGTLSWNTTLASGIGNHQGNMYVTNARSNTVSVISSSNTVIATVPVGNHPIGIAYNPDNGNIYVANAGSSSVSVLSTSTNTVIATVPVGNGPYAIAYDPDNGNMYVTNAFANSVSIISSSNIVIAAVPVGNYPCSIAYDPDNGKMYVTNMLDGTVSIIPTLTSSGFGTVRIGPAGGSSLCGIAYNPDNENIYVVDWLLGQVSVMSTSTNTVIATVPVGSDPVGIAYDPDNGNMYVATNGSVISVISPSNTVTNIWSLGGGPYAIAYNPDNENIYVANWYDNTVSVISTSTNTVLTTLPAGMQPYGIAFGGPEVSSTTSSISFRIDNSSMYPVITPSNIEITLSSSPFDQIWVGGFSAVNNSVIPKYLYPGQTFSYAIVVGLGINATAMYGSSFYESINIPMIPAR